MILCVWHIYCHIVYNSVDVSFFMIYSADINECLDSQSNNCDDICVNTEGSFHCTCRESFRISTDGRSCIPVCGGNITIGSDDSSGIDSSSNSGSVATPGWPEFYPSSDFTCEWTFEASNNTIIDFTFEEQFGIRGSQPCTTDYIEIFDGSRNTESVSLGKFCSLQVPESVSTSSNSAIIVFQASSHSHSAAHVGANISYTTLEKGDRFIAISHLQTWAYISLYVFDYFLTLPLSSNSE